MQGSIVSLASIISMHVHILMQAMISDALLYLHICFIQKEFFQLKELEKMAPKLKGISEWRSVSEGCPAEPGG